MKKVKGMRVLTGMSQQEMASMMNISLSSYRKKENGLVAFNDEEKINFIELVREYYDVATIENIFFNA